MVPDEYKDQKNETKPAAKEKREQTTQKPKDSDTKNTQKEAVKEPAKESKDAAKENTEKADSKPTPLLSAPADANVPVFKVQILTGRTKLQPNDRQFKGLADIDCFEEAGIYKYTVGASTDYNAIARQRREILDKFPEAFIIAFKNGQKMNVNEAIAEFKKNKGK